MSTAVAPAPTAAAQPSAEVARARVAIMVSTYQVDVVVPTKFTIETFIDDLLAVLSRAIDDETVDFTPPNGQWSLARPGEAPMPRWRSLADHEVDDGTVLMLATVESAEVFTPVVEDITDALALINEREFAEYDDTTAAITGLSALAAGAVTIAVLLSWSWTMTGSVLWCTLPALALGLACAGAAVATRRRGATGRISFGLTVAALPLLFAGGAMLVPTAYGVPGPFAAANVAAGAVFAAVAAVVMMRVTGLGIATLMAITVLGVLAAAAAIPLTYLDVSLRQVAGGTVLVALVLLTIAARLAVVIARIRPPDLPDPGTEVAPTTLTDIFDAESAGSDRPEDTDRDRDRAGGIEGRARLAVTSLRGLLSAISAVLAAATVAAAAAGPGGIREIVLVGAVTGLLAMRARWHPDRVQAIALLAAAVCTVAGTAVVLVGAYGSPLARLVVVLIVAVAAGVGCAAAVKLPGTRLSPVTRRVIDLVEYAFILVVPIIALWIMGVYTAMRAI
ncbi:type VII secretion integral membrane protein EccD [Nocardia brasiliensis]|uniref:type VII secretion integral membrane protein EccD n=1 Tax=Nocardia brasiliensis TaxID=37326 RepID=UPI0024541A00|nr:type VII secretion integral membrane protein EccD [Nocardia brasiliensis]